MRIETSQIGDVVSLGDGIRLTIHGRQAARIVLGVTAPAGTALTFAGADLRPACSSPGTWDYLFSLQAIRGFRIGDFDVRVWLPGELIPAAACEDWLHIGIAARSDAVPHGCRSPDTALPAPVVPGRPLARAGRLFSRSA